MIDWNQIVADHGRRVFVLAQRVLGNASDAEEVAQEVLAEADRLAQIESVRSWPGLLAVVPRIGRSIVYANDDQQDRSTTSHRRAMPIRESSRRPMS